MSKELDYIQMQKKIVEQQVKGSNMKIIVTDAFTKHQYDYYEKELQTLESIESGLKRLEAIDNAVEICKKANEQKYVFIKETYGIVKEKFLDDLDYEILNNRLYVNSRGMYYDFPLKNYGNLWALTKGELKNE